MNFLLELTPYTQSVIEGLGIFAVGLLTVFGVLIMIWGVLALFNIFFGKQKKGATAKTSEPAAAAPVAPRAASNDEIIAVIAAAIAMAESESGGAKFRVVSFKRK